MKSVNSKRAAGLAAVVFLVFSSASMSETVARVDARDNYVLLHLDTPPQSQAACQEQGYYWEFAIDISTPIGQAQFDLVVEAMNARNNLALQSDTTCVDISGHSVSKIHSVQIDPPDLVLSLGGLHGFTGNRKITSLSCHFDRDWCWVKLSGGTIGPTTTPSGGSCNTNQVRFEYDSGNGERVYDLLSFALENDLAVDIALAEECFQPQPQYPTVKWVNVVERTRQFSNILQASDMEIARIIASSTESANAHMVQWVGDLDAACQVAGNSASRTRFRQEDQALMSLLLTAKATGKKVSFFYTVDSDLDSLQGHASGCQIVNAWVN